MQNAQMDIGSFRGGAMGGGGKGAKAPLKISKKRKIKKYGVFSGIKVNKMSFSVIFNKEIRALEGFYHDFSTNDLPRRCPWVH